MKTKGKIFIISGPSGSGKTTLYKKLLTSKKLKNKIVKIVSVTTRQKRDGEIHGRDYIFISQRRYLYKKRKDHFLETQKVFDSHYGTPKDKVHQLLKMGKNVLLCIDVKGAKVIKRKFPKAVTIFIKTKSKNVLKKRLLNRGSEDKKRLELRLKTAENELKEGKTYNYQVINESINTALRELEKIILSEVNLA